VASIPRSAIWSAPKKGRLNLLEQQLLTKPRQEAGPGVEVKLLPEDDELYVFAQSIAVLPRNVPCAGRQLKRLWARLQRLSAMRLTREELLMKLDAARAKAPTAWCVVEVKVEKRSAASSRIGLIATSCAKGNASRYLLRTNRTEHDPAKLWRYYLQLPRDGL
jgi:hypothetical protein